MCCSLLMFIQENEDNSQKHIYEFQKPAEEYDLRLSVAKTKIIMFHGKLQYDCKLCVTQLWKTGQKVNYEGCCVVYGHNEDLTSRVI